MNTAPLTPPSMTAQLELRGIAGTTAANGWQEGNYTPKGGAFSYGGFWHFIFDENGQKVIGTNGKPVKGFKNASKDKGAHDAWTRNIPDGVKYLMLPSWSIKEAITRHGGVLFGAEGKADTHSLWEAGLENAIGIFGTSGIADNIAVQFQSWDVQHFSYYAHPDKSGLDAAYKMFTLLDGSGITIHLFVCPRTPDGKKKDLNDLWIESSFDPDAFTDKLGDLDRLLPQLVVLPKAAPKPPSSALWSALDSENAKEQIKRLLPCYDYMLEWFGEPKQRGADGGFWLAPNRDERTASFYAYDGDRGWFDFGADADGDVFTLDMLRYGGDFADALERLADRCGVKLPTRNASAYTRPVLAIVPKSDPSVASGLPVRLRARLNTHCHPAIAPALELHTEAVQRGLVEQDKALTRSDLLELAAQTGRGVSADTIQTATDQGAGQFLVVLPLDSYQEEKYDPPSGKTPKNTTPGRNSTRYVIPPLDQIVAEVRRQGRARLWDEHFPADDPLVAPLRQELFTSQGIAPDTAEAITQLLKARYGEQIAAQPGLAARSKAYLDAIAELDKDLDDPTTAPILPGWEYRERSQYAACCARAIVEAEGGQAQHTKPQWAKLLGKSQRTVKDTLRRAGIEDKETYRSEKVVTSAAELPDSPSQWQKLIAFDEQREPVAKFDYLEDRQAAGQFIAKHQRAGRVVEFATQIANRQKVSSAEQPAREPRKPRTPAEPTPRSARNVGNSQPKLTPVRRPYFGRGLNPDNWRNYPVKLAKLAIGRADPETGEIIETAQLALEVLLRHEGNALALLDHIKSAQPLTPPLTDSDAPLHNGGGSEVSTPIDRASIEHAPSAVNEDKNMHSEVERELDQEAIRLPTPAPKPPTIGEQRTYNGITLVYDGRAWRDDRPIAEKLAGLPRCGVSSTPDAPLFARATSAAD